jgi:hypothetical protein
MIDIATVSWADLGWIIARLRAGHVADRLGAGGIRPRQIDWRPSAWLRIDARPGLPAGRDDHRRAGSARRRCSPIIRAPPRGDAVEAGDLTEQE